MVAPLTDSISKIVQARLGRILDAAEVGIPTEHQFQAFRKIVLNEFGNQGLLPELEALIVKQHGQARRGQADTAGKEVP